MTSMSSEYAEKEATLQNIFHQTIVKDLTTNNMLIR